MKDRIAFQNTKVTLESMSCVRVIGRGGFGVVKMVQAAPRVARDLLPAVFHLRTALAASACPACPSLECPHVALPACPGLQCGDCSCPEPAGLGGLGPLLWAGAGIALASAVVGGFTGFLLGALVGVPCGGRWVCLTPDLQLQIHDLNDQRHKVLSRRAAFLANVAAASYVFDDDAVSAAQMEEFRSQAKVQAAILGDGEFDDVEVHKWVVYQVDDEHFGKEVPEEVLADGQRFVHLGNLGVVDWLGAKRFVERVRDDKVDDWKEKRESSEGDSRILGLHRKRGKRNLALSDAVDLFTEETFDDWPFPPPRAAKEYLESIRDGPGSMVVYESEWRQDSGVGDGTAALHEHRNNTEVLRLAHQVDQLNVPNLACFEQLVRRQIQIEMAVERNAKHPDYAGLDLVMGGPTTESGAAASAGFRGWIYKKQGERAQTLKQSRLLREERLNEDKRHRSGKACPSPPTVLTVEALASGGDSAARGVRGTPLQCDVLQHVARRVKAYGPPPRDLDEDGALAELLASRDLYSQEPKNLAEYDISKLKICRSGTVAKDAKTLLPPETAGLIKHYKHCVERDAEQILEARAAVDFPRPYWDPKLARDHDSLFELVGRLRDANLIGFRKKLKAKVGIFFVKKKDPAWIRLIIGARQANRCHKTPPKTRLGSVGGFCELDLSDTALQDLGGFGGISEIWGGTSDVDDCFYQMLVEELGSWFGIDLPRAAGAWGVTQVYDDDLGRRVAVGPSEVVYPVFHGMAMGWAWALHFANEAISHLATKSAVCPRSLVRERTPAPVLRAGQAVSGVYVDNFTTLAGDRETALDSVQRFRHAAEEAHIGTHVDSEVAVVFESLGVVFDGKRRCLRHVPRRAWRVYLATRALRRRRWIHGNVMEIWLGHVVNLFSLSRPALACLQAVYPFVAAARGRRVRLTPAIKNEMRLVQGLLFLSEYDLGADFSHEVYCSDSSSFGYALLSTTATSSELRDLTRYRERWRFKLVDTLPEVGLLRPEWVEYAGGRLAPGGSWEFPEGAYADVAVRGSRPCAIGPQTQFGRSLEAASQERPFSRPRVGRRSREPRPRPRQEEVEVPSAVPPIDRCWDDLRRWRHLRVGRWRWTEEHINVKEGRVSLFGLRRATRSRHNHGKRVASIGDNLVSICAFEKGRAKSWALNALARRAASYQIAARIRWHSRHVESKRNVADAGSRLHETVALELFAGEAGLTCALRSRGLRVGPPFELERGAKFDLTRKSTQNLIKSWILSGLIWYIHLGTPCTVWSVARRGVSNLGKAYAKEAVAVELALFTVEVCVLASRCGVLWSLENPSSSGLWEFKPVVDLMGLPKVFKVSFHMCQYEVLHKKPTTVLTNLSVLGVMCIASLKGRSESWEQMDQVLSTSGMKILPRLSDGDGIQPSRERLRGVVKGAILKSPLERRTTSATTGYGLAATARSGPRRQKALRRQAVAARAAAPPDRFLQESTAGDKAKDIYRRELEKFYDWAEQQSRPVGSLSLATTMKEYFFSKFQEGYGPSVGRAVFFGYLLLKSNNYKQERERLSDVERAIAGWAKRSREVVKDPAPQEVLLDMGAWMLDNGRGESAACLALQLDDYGRPSESVELVVGNMLPPVPGVRGTASRDWGVVFAPAELGFVTKTGQVDDSVVLGSPSRPWAPKVAAALVQRVTQTSGGRSMPADPRAPLFRSLTLAKYEHDFKAASKALNYTKLNVTPHTVRHTAPSHDIYHKHRNLEQVRRRGRWAAKKSVTRYERHAKLLKQYNKLDRVQISRMNRSAQSFPDKLLSYLRKR
ncbi:unnamed protein product [Prorocentrum cordatum]|uniref:Uncharacterized protein n=1 Tax=Prorocentrum cordatum TaxID=2364126 RepID=A0ABN9PIP1_9DINO|nr:unnamed protein product [Polarella glacialis]